MNWINGFELMCYGITAMLLADVFIRKQWRELRLFCSAALAGFILELLAVRVTDIYHYSPDFYISIGFAPYQFPFFGGLMWGGLTVCGLRIANKLQLSKLMTALCTGWLIVSMDMLLDVAAIRMNGGFWVWEGRPITLDVSHHMFMSVIWVNFLGYLFETPAVVFFSLTMEEHKAERTPAQLALLTIAVGLGGVAVVGAASGVSLFLNSITDEWFSFIAYLLLWDWITFRLIRHIIQQRNLLSFSGKKDWPLTIFWSAMYGYCLASLWSLKILQTIPLYGIFAVMLACGTLMLCLVGRKERNLR